MESNLHLRDVLPEIQRFYRSFSQLFLVNSDDEIETFVIIMISTTGMFTKKIDQHQMASTICRRNDSEIPMNI